MLISGVQQSDSTIYIHISIIFQVFSYICYYRILSRVHFKYSSVYVSLKLPIIIPSTFLGLQNHCRCDCSHEIKRHLLLGRKVMTNLDSIFKSRDIILPTKVRLVKAMVFPVVIYGCESCTVKKAERRRIYSFELWCWRRF